MEPTAYRNNARSRYFRLRNPTSSLRGRRKLRPKVWRPSRHRYSEAVPTGHSQPQKLLRKIQEAARKAISRNIPAGRRRGICPLRRSTFRFISEAIGSQPSTPRGGGGLAPPSGGESPSRFRRGGRATGPPPPGGPPPHTRAPRVVLSGQN